MESLLVIVPRTLLGLLFLSAALDGFSYLLRGVEIFTPPLSENGKAFLADLKKRPVIWAAKATIDLIAALMLLANFHAPLAVLLVLPSTIVIILFQFSVNRIGIPVGIVLSILMMAMGAHYFDFYRPLLSAEDGRGPLAAGPYGHPLEAGR